jgi:hypothetical protein
MCTFCRLRNPPLGPSTLTAGDGLVFSSVWSIQDRISSSTYAVTASRKSLQFDQRVPTGPRLTYEAARAACRLTETISPAHASFMPRRAHNSRIVFS